jgi:hypothetical protein
MTAEPAKARLRRRRFTSELFSIPLDSVYVAAEAGTRINCNEPM